MTAEDIYKFWKKRDNRDPKSMNNRAKLQYVDEKVESHVRKIAVHTRSKDELLNWANNTILGDIVKNIKHQRDGSPTTMRAKSHLVQLLLEKYKAEVSKEENDITFTLFRSEDSFELLRDTKIETSPVKDHHKGFYNQKENKAIVDFANKGLGGHIFGKGMTQEETMFLEHFGYSLMVSKQAHEDGEVDPTFSMKPTESWILSGAHRLYEFPGGMYGRKVDNWKKVLEDKHALTEKTHQPHVIAIDAIRIPTNEAYTEEMLVTMIRKAYTGFSAAKQMGIVNEDDSIATAGWGAGIFGHRADVMYAVQAIAAVLAGVQLEYYDYNPHKEVQGLFEECLNLTAQQCVNKIVEKKLVTKKAE